MESRSDKQRRRHELFAREELTMDSVEAYRAIDVYRDEGQIWAKCPYEWGIDDWITVQSSCGLLVLCQKSFCITGAHIGDVIITPIHKNELTEVPTQAKP